MLFRSMVWYGMVWYGMVWYGMVWYGMAWYGMVWYGMVWYGIPVRGGTQNFGVLLVRVLVWIKNPANLLVWVGLMPTNFGDNSVFKG